MEFARTYLADTHTPHAARIDVGQALADFDREVIEDVQLLVSELITNSIRHAGLGSEGDVVLHVAVSGKVLRIVVSDFGPGFDGSKVQGDGLDGGWGLPLVERISDRWGHVRGPPSSVWLEIDMPRRDGEADVVSDQSIAHDRDGGVIERNGDVQTEAEVVTPEG